MLRKLLSVGGFTLLSRITGFVRDMLMAWIMGHGILSDAFVVAFLFPNNFRAIFGEGTINPAFLPRYAALNARGETAEAAAFANAIFSWQMAAQVVLLVLALVFMPQIIHVLAPGFSDDPAQFALTVELARITFPYLLLTVVAVQLSAMLNAVDRFWAGAAWPILLNLSMVATLVCWHWFPNAALAAAWGVLIGGVAQLVFILWAGRKDGLWLRPALPRWSPQVAEFFKAFGAVTIGAASVVIAPMIDTILASLLPTGSRTALYYADRINQLPLGVLGIALGTVILPVMSAHLAKGDRAASDAAQNRSAALSLLLTLPFALSFIAVSGTIMRAIFAHGAFDAQAAMLAGYVLAAYAVGLPAMAMLRIAASTFYARHDTMTPVRATLIAMAANIALKFVFVWGLGMGVPGIALGTGLGAWINLGILCWMGRQRDLLALDEKFRRALLPVGLAALACAFAAWLGAHLGETVMPGRFADETGLVLALLFGTIAWANMVLVFRKRLPLGRAAQ